MSTPAPFRVAFVGVGHWHAPMYLDPLKRLGQQVVAVWDPDAQVAQREATALGATTQPDLGELLVRSHPDIIIGMSIHAQMPALLATMLQVPAALILEKPLGIHARDIAPLVAQAEKEERFAAVAFVNRYTTIWQKWAELQEVGRLGTPSYAHFHVINGAPQRYVRDGVSWMLDARQSGGGSLINLGTHTLDAFRRFAGDPVAVVSAQLGYRAHNASVEDFSLAVLKSDSGVFGSVESGYCYAGMSGGDQEWRLVTSNAYLRQDSDSLTVKTLDDDKLEKMPIISSKEAYELFVADSLERIRRGDAPHASLRDGLKVLELVDEIYRVAERNGFSNVH
jgi:predicted dehydrogenase